MKNQRDQDVVGYGFDPDAYRSIELQNGPFFGFAGQELCKVYNKLQNENYYSTKLIFDYMPV